MKRGKILEYAAQREGFAYKTVGTKLLLCCTFIVLGSFRYVPGTTIHGLETQISEKLYFTSFIYVARSVGYAIGCISGFIGAKLLLISHYTHLFFSMSMFFLSGSIFCITVSTSYVPLLSSFFLSGIFMAGLHISANVVMLHSSAFNISFFYILFLFYSIGSCLGTVVVKQNVFENESINLETGPGRRSVSQRITSVYKYLVGASFLVSILWLALYCLIADDRPEVVEHRRHSDDDLLPVGFKRFAMFNMAILIFITCCIDYSYSQILPTYGMLQLGMNYRQSFDLLLVFLGSMTAGRFIRCFLPETVKSYSLVCIGFILIYIGALILFVYFKREDRLSFLVANGFIGFGVSPIILSVVDWFAYRMEITYKQVIPMYFMAELSEVFLPVLFLRSRRPVYTNIRNFILVGSLLCLLFFIIQYIILHPIYKLYKADAVLPVLGPRWAKYLSAEQLSRQRSALRNQHSTSKNETNWDEESVNVFDLLEDARKRLVYNNRSVKSLLRELQEGGIGQIEKTTKSEIVQRETDSFWDLKNGNELKEESISMPSLPSKNDSDSSFSLTSNDSSASSKRKSQ